MKILWMTWKDGLHPNAGGAESINEGLATKLVEDGHEVIFLVSGFKNSPETGNKKKFTIYRLGGRISVYWRAYQFYKNNLSHWPDLIIDEMNTIPFLCNIYAKQRTVLLSYQLCREIWFYQMKLPMSIFGYIVEPIYLWFMRNMEVLTESASTARDLIKFGFKEENIKIFPIFISNEAIKEKISDDKYSVPTILSFGEIRPMKKTLEQILAFEIAKKSIHSLKLIIAGNANNAYGRMVLKRILISPFKEDITYLGKVNESAKRDIMRRSHFILVTSLKEGWGLIVTEANSFGTPAIVYDSDGLRDSVQNNLTGFIVDKNDPKNLALKIIEGFSMGDNYEAMQINAKEFSSQFSIDNSYKIFLNALKIE